MKLVLRTLAVLTAVAAVIDPALARKAEVPLAIDVRLPDPSHPRFARADALRQAVLREVDGDIEVDGPREPQAIVAIGDAAIDEASGAPLFFLPADTAWPAMRIQRFDAASWSPSGRAVHVTARVMASGLAGRKSTISLRLRGATVASVAHRWDSDNEIFDAALSFAPPSTGAHRVRLVARADGEPDAVVADALVNVRDQPLRVLVYEARPTWPVAFARRTLEADAMFDVAATSRSSRPVATIAGGAPMRLDRLDADRFDVVLAGALDELRPEDLGALERFVSVRGGTIVLAPDRRIPRAAARQFGLPEAVEVLLEQPVEVQQAVAPVRGSELLLFEPDGDADTLGVVPHAGGVRPVVAAFPRGEGHVVVSGLLDAWRFRGGPAGAFDTFWRSLVADAALAARPPVDVRLAPTAARPGETVRISAQIRSTELVARDDGVAVEGLTAVLAGTDGRQEIIRLWPATRAGSFEGRLRAPVAGGYTVRATLGRFSTEVPLLVAGDVVQADSDAGAALRFAAAASGGAVVAAPADVVRALASVPRATLERESRPMRSPWWIVPFAGLLCAEWTLRRRSGLR